MPAQPVPEHFYTKNTLMHYCPAGTDQTIYHINDKIYISFSENQIIVIPSHNAHICRIYCRIVLICCKQENSWTGLFLNDISKHIWSNVGPFVRMMLYIKKHIPLHDKVEFMIFGAVVIVGNEVIVIVTKGYFLYNDKSQYIIIFPIVALGDSLHEKLIACKLIFQCFCFCDLMPPPFFFVSLVFEFNWLMISIALFCNYRHLIFWSVYSS